MDTDKPAPIYKAESRQIDGCAMDVLNELGHGFHEKPYEILYKNEKVGDYIPDLLAFDKIVVDTKVFEKNHG